MRLAGFERGDGRTIVVENAVAGVRGDARAGHDDAGEIQWIGSAHGDQIVLCPFTTDRAQHADSFGQGKLFTRDAAHETSATNLTTRLESMIETQQHPPRQRQAFAFDTAFENDAVAFERSEESRV